MNESHHLHEGSGMEITRADLAASTREVKEYIAERVDRVEGQLTTLSNRVIRHGELLSAYHERIKAVEKDVEEDTGVVTLPDDQVPGITRRDVKLMCWVGGGLIAGVEVLHRAYEIFAKVVTP